MKAGQVSVDKPLMILFYRAFTECVLTFLNWFYGLALSVLNKIVKVNSEITATPLRSPSDLHIKQLLNKLACLQLPSPVFRVPCAALWPEPTSTLFNSLLRLC